jgi:hypothetical protein
MAYLVIPSGIWPWKCMVGMLGAVLGGKKAFCFSSGAWLLCGGAEPLYLLGL